MDNTVNDILKILNINYKIENIEGTLIERSILMDNTKYNNVKEKIPMLKKIYSSSFLTSLQNNALERQKWPLLNLIRQIFKARNYNMKPIRRSNGYTKAGKKLYKRYFKIEKILTISSI